ncbi:MAG: hypothetical protein GY743_23425 [Planctomycetaceae bacterium]|nr:hypothetical protein [Planctomycetaceae bacterium]
MAVEAIEFRFKLYPHSDRRLLARIEEQADGANKNNAARFLLRHWFENERQAILPHLGQTCTPQLGQNEPSFDEQLETALSEIDDAWGD